VFESGRSTKTTSCLEIQHVMYSTVSCTISSRNKLSGSQK